jgi:hypothetical protein
MSYSERFSIPEVSNQIIIENHIKLVKKTKKKKKNVFVWLIIKISHV